MEGIYKTGVLGAGLGLGANRRRTSDTSDENSNPRASSMSANGT
jgi:hypothetical protein